MKFKNYIIIAVFILFGTTACKKDFLQVVNKTVLLKEGYVVDLKTTGEFVNGIYMDLANYYANGTFLPYPEVMADNMKMLGTKAFVQVYSWNYSSSVTSTNLGDPVYMWRQYYDEIRNCNFVLEKADKFKSEDETKANNLKGQVLAIRAMLHFTLCNIFSQAYNFTQDATHPGVPYITSYDLESPVSRQTVAEVYDHMINDLKQALELLPAGTTVEKRMMNYQATSALLARIYLFKEDYTNAKNLSRQVLADVPLVTGADYPTKLYTDNDKEALFWMPPGSTTGTTPTPGYSGVFIGYYASTKGGLYYCATKDIAQILNENPNDKRRAWVKDTAGNWQIRKFPKSVAGPSATAELNYNQPLFRSSEMCLTAAEAYARLNMVDSARFYIDQIRQRADPALPSIAATGQALLDSIYKERRKEMCFDGLRMWDLKRWKMGVNRGDVFGAVPVSMPYPSSLAVASIPLNDVLLSKLEQNDGH